MNMNWIGSAIDAVSRRTNRHASEVHSEQVARQGREWQEGMDATTIRRRVHDAAMAGIHPLYALGVQPSSFDAGGSVQYDGGGTSFSGVDFTGRQAQRDELNAQLVQAQIKSLNSEANRNDAVAQATAASAMSRVAQSANVTQDQDSRFGTVFMDTPLTFPRGKTKAQDLEDFFGDAAAEVEMFPLYVKQKGQQTAEEYRDFLDSMFDRAFRYLDLKFGLGRDVNRGSKFGK